MKETEDNKVYIDKKDAIFGNVKGRIVLSKSGTLDEDTTCLNCRPVKKDYHGEVNSGGKGVWKDNKPIVLNFK